jgi:hypothetical protein
MNGVQIFQKILYGYAKAAQHLGAEFLLYRSAIPINPIAPGNLIGTILADTNVSWEYMKANFYGNAVWNLLIDAQQSSLPLAGKVGDYLVGVTDGSGLPFDNSTYFIQVLDYDLPPKAIKCNQTINMIRPTSATGAGNQGYSSYTPATAQTIMTAMPAAVLLESKGRDAKTQLPTDTRNPAWLVLLPNLGGVNVRVGDIIIDNMNQNYVVHDNELTELGWRLRAEQTFNYRG